MTNERRGAQDIQTRRTNPSDDVPIAEGGEGNIEADRNYRAGVADTLAHQDVEKLAKEAKEALDGPEGKKLRKAERKAKKGKALKHP
jgi:hypothetical protein